MDNLSDYSTICPFFVDRDKVVCYTETKKKEKDI